MASSPRLNQEAGTAKSDAPNPDLGLSLEAFTEFTDLVKRSPRIFALIGAGLSASCGLATFRGEDRLWRGLEPADLGWASKFDEDPVLVWWLFTDRMMRSQRAKPNAGHVALAKLAEQHPGFFAVNQNVDGLLHRSGFPPSQIAQIHGDLFSIKCSNKDCDYVANVTYPINKGLTIPEGADISDANVPLPNISREDLPHCPKCNHLLRPNVVWFGESIKQETLDRIYAFQSIGAIDLMLVVGTSCVVLPASMYIKSARLAGARVAMFNLDDSDESEMAELYRGDWFFKGDAAVTVAEMLKGVIGNVVGHDR
ncbi:NAD-dependent deacetylase sirtuin-5 [Lophiotrema nucula]|uniref:NAD-dependent deacetylase sirtuin-5 n=1 Tax=Lophiotrema nucula TaxID=690887 RepID=A0A6A5YLX1_9PLEO|nr:NAD-dependent deacetylase sirtuin-5 [Lophiotrema nucula]